MSAVVMDLRLGNEGLEQDSPWRTLAPGCQLGRGAVPSGVDPSLLASLDFSGCVFRVSAGDHHLMARDPSGPRTRSAASGIGLNQECGDERALCANSSGERAL